jgi:hypothetical protein
MQPGVEMLSTKKLIAIGALIAAGGSGVANAAYVTTFTDGLNTQVSGATVYDFDSGKPANYSGQGSVLSTSVSGMAAQPAGDNTPYLSVAYPDASGLEWFTASPGASYNYFGLYWGSIDDYNSLRFYNGNDLVAEVTGASVIQTGTQFGDQMAAGSNRYVNFLFTDQTFNRVQFKTTQYAFESDNHAYANVPEPGTLALMGAAFAGLALQRRRQKIANRSST